MQQDTIVAISTPHGQGPTATIRLSGPDAFNILSKIWKGKNLDQCKSHTAHLGNINDCNDKLLDQALITLFHAPNSFTGENIAEISIHGSTWIQQTLVNTLIQKGARPALPGEFSQRAFLNKKIDLAQAEGIADLIAAKSKAAHSLATSQTTGAFSSHINKLRNKLIQLSSLLELELDFSEEDVQFADRQQLLEITDQIIKTLSTLQQSFHDGKAFKEGIPVAIIGQPNAGKSSLLNSLLGYDKAIVTNIPGTTRDTIDETTEINGILFRFIDTAGLRDTSDPIEKIGIQRTKQSIQKATIILHLHPADTKQNTSSTSATDQPLQPTQTTLHITTKDDLLPSPPDQTISTTPSDLTISTKTGHNTTTHSDLTISTKTGHNIDSLKRLLTETATKRHNPDHEIMLTNQRHYHDITKALESITRARQTIEDALPPDLTAQDLRQTLHHLSTLTGEIPPEAIHQSIFSHFCIGK